MNFGPSVVLLLLAPAALAQPGASPWSEEEFVRAALADPAAASALAGERDLAAADRLRASLLPAPLLDATREEPGRHTAETLVSLSWVPPLDGRRALRRAAAASGLDAAEHRLADARRRLRLELREVYAEWAVALAGRDLAATHHQRVRELAGTARTRAAAGEIAGLAARRLALEQAQARADLAQAEARLAAARAAALAASPALPPDARPELPRLPPLADAPESFGDRPDLAALEREVERAEALAALSRRVLDAPALGLGWKRVEEPAGDAEGPVFSLAWTLPLFDRGQADRLEAQATLTNARARSELARRRAQADRAGAAAAYLALRLEAEEADRTAADTAEVMAGAEAAYRLGESGLTDLLDTLRAVLAARRGALEGHAAALAALRRLEAAAGEPSTPPSTALPSASASGGLP